MFYGSPVQQSSDLLSRWRSIRASPIVNSDVTMSGSCSSIVPSDGVGPLAASARLTTTSATAMLLPGSHEMAGGIHSSNWINVPLSRLIPHLKDHLPLDLRREIRQMLWEPLTDCTIPLAMNTWDVGGRICQRFGPIELWDVRRVSNMDELFRDMSKFNENLSRWDVSNVRSMRGMFERCGQFNRPLSGWNVSNVRCMRRMFANCSTFNQAIGNWSVGRVEDMSDMFGDCKTFNQPIGNWDVSSVVNMRGMFERAKVFNQDVSGWSMGRVQVTSSMFCFAKAFNQPLSEWAVSQVVAMNRMFHGAVSFNQSLSEWDVSRVMTCQSMVYGSSVPRTMLPLQWNGNETMVASAVGQ